MNGIAVQPWSESHEFQEATAYLVRIRGSWFRVERTSCPLYNGTKQVSGNMLKWDSYGESDQLSITPCEPPDQALPDIVRQFVENHVATGCVQAKFVVHHKKMADHVPVGAKEGWQEEKQK